jgi:hypothetical protein
VSTSSEGSQKSVVGIMTKRAIADAVIDSYED